MLSTILEFIKNEPKFVISLAFSIVSIIVNIIFSIKHKNISRLKEALLSLTEVISEVETISGEVDFEKSHLDKSTWKKGLALSICERKFGKIYLKNSKLFDDAIEDILTTPQKKGGSVDVSQKN